MVFAVIVLATIGAMNIAELTGYVSNEYLKA